MCPTPHEIKTALELLILGFHSQTLGLHALLSRPTFKGWFWNTRPFTRESLSLILGRQHWSGLYFPSELQRVTFQSQTSKVSEGDIVLLAEETNGTQRGKPLALGGTFTEGVLCFSLFPVGLSGLFSAL